MEKSYSSLLSLICEVRLSYLRINDVAVANGELTIAFYDVKDASGKVDVRVCLKDDKSNEYALSIKQLASLRVETGNVQSTWLDEFKNDVGGANFQSIVKGMIESGKSLEGLKFKVVKQLRVKNNQVANTVTPVYKDFCYEGSSEYTKGVRALLSGKSAEFFATADYSRGMAELRERLHATAVKQGQATEANLVLLPVFKVY